MVWREGKEDKSGKGSSHGGRERGWEVSEAAKVEWKDEGMEGRRE